MAKPQMNEQGAPIFVFWNPTDIQEKGRKMLLPKQAVMEEPQHLSFLSDHFPAAHTEELEYHSQDSEPTYV